MRQFSCVTKENKLEVVMRIFQRWLRQVSLANQGQKRKFSRAGSWLTLFVDPQFITDVTFGHYDRFAYIGFGKLFWKID